MATHVDVVADFDDRSVMASANDLKRNIERTGDETGQAWGQGFSRGADGRLRDARGRFVKIGQDLGGDLGKGMSEGLDKELPRFKAGLADAANATRAFRDEQQKLQSLMRSGAGWDDIARQSERTANAHNFARDSARDAGGAFKELENAQKALSNSSQGLMGALTDVGGALRGLSSVAMPAGIIALSAAAVELAGVAASASQALWLIPAAAGAAGAAIGTVALATYGFGDALKAAGDPKKFAEALQQLSPNAQQAALSIQQLMPAFTQLRQATSDAFFANVGPQLTELSNQFLPTIRTLTTGIAGAFNQAFSGVAQQLMTPETQSAITGFVNNVVAAFRELAPAAAPMVKAFADLAEVGSKVLPDIARGAAEAAKQFSAFIEVHSQNGDISRWLNEGLDTLKQLIPLAVELGKDFMALAPIGRAILPDIVSALKSIGDLVPIIGTALIPLGPAFGMWTTMLGPAVKLLGMAADAIAFISGDAGRIAQSDLLGAQINAAVTAAGGGTGVAPGVNRTALPTTGGDPALGGAGGLLPLPSAAANAGGGIGRAFNPIQPGSAWQTPRGVGNTIGGSAAGPHGAGSTGLPQAPALPYDTTLPAGYANLPQTAEIVGAENSFMDARHAVAEKQARVAQLEKDTTATEADRVKANNDVINAKQQQQQAELRLQDAAKSLYTKTTQDLNDFGAKIDQDFGISKGLPGIADNLVRFLGNLIAAPAMAQLNAISNAPGQAQGGFGLMGVLGAQGAFGPQYTAAAQAAASGGSSASALGPAALMPPGASGYPGDAALLSQVRPGDYVSKAGVGDLTKGIGDCSSAVEDLVDILDGRPTGGRDLSTGNAAQWLTDHGFQPGAGGPGDFRVGYNASHMQATLPGGTNFNWGTQAAAASGGVAPNSGAAFGNQHYYRPASGAPGLGLVGSTGENPLDPYHMANPGELHTPLGGSFAGRSASGDNVGGGRFNPGVRLDTSNASVYQPSLFGSNIGASGDAPPPAGYPTIGGGAPGLGFVGQPTGWGVGAGASAGGVGAGIGNVGAGGVGGPGAGPTQIGAAVSPASGSGQGGIGIAPGGSLDTALGLAASAFPGMGQAAQTGVKLASRAIQFAGQAAAIGVQGAMDTFLPTGGSELANHSWFSKILGGLAGAAPALPNMAGKAAAATGKEGQQGGQQMGAGMGNVQNINVTSNRQEDQGLARDTAYHAQQAQLPPGRP